MQAIEQSKLEQKDTELCDMKSTVENLRSTIENLRRMTGLAHTDILHTTQHRALNLHTTAAQNQGMYTSTIHRCVSIYSVCLYDVIFMQLQLWHVCSDPNRITRLLQVFNLILCQVEPI